MVMGPPGSLKGSCKTFSGLHRNYSSCTEALRVNLGRVGNYRIRHDNMTRAIDVECKFIDNEVRAIVHHDSEFQGVVNGSEGAGAFRQENVTLMNY